MKTLITLVLCCLCSAVYSAEERSVLVASPSPTVANEPTIATTSAATEIATVTATATQIVAVDSAPTCKGPNCVNYRHKGKIAPCAVPTAVGVCMTETGCDACCQKVTTRTPVSVEICAPPCPTKNTVRSSKDGSRKVYDYGRYEAVVTGKDGVVDVKYRKRFLNR
jgi:hypothetical protein